ncbi:MAG: hypothetical protein ACD_44C00416G0001 [uncultured bacterium]|nr:MAG: hypothetical protein ACD_44C00416G0001 [uncultured bacterium]
MPVKIKRSSFEGIIVASINKMSPPACVQANPVATPGRVVRSATSSKNLIDPNNSFTFSGVIVFSVLFNLSPAAIRFAVFRHKAAILRSKLRTPASRV